MGGDQENPSGGRQEVPMDVGGDQENPSGDRQEVPMDVPILEIGNVFPLGSPSKTT